VNQEEHDDEITVDLKDWFLRVLKKWYLLVLAVIIGAAAAAGIDYSRADSAEQETVSASAQAVSGQTSDNTEATTFAELQQHADLQTYSEYVALAENYRDYLKNSVLMNVDATSVAQTSETYLISTDSEKDYAVFYQVTPDKEMLKKASEATGIDDSRISELISISSPVRADAVQVSTGSDQNVSLTVDSEDDTDAEEKPIYYVMTVIITGQNEEQCDQLAEAVNDLFARKAATANSSSLSVSLVNEQSRHYQDTSLANNQASICQAYKDALDDAQSIYDSLSDNDKKLADEIISSGKSVDELLTEAKKESVNSASGTDADTVSTANNNSGIHAVSTKHLAIGCVIAAAVMLLIELIYYLLDNHVKTEDEITDTYGISNLGVFRQDTGKQLTEFIAAVLEKQKIKRLFLGELSEGGSGKLQQLLAEACPDVEILAGDIQESDQLTASDAVILLTAVNKTKRKDLKKFMNIIRISDTKVLGYVNVTAD
jgi:capsular polysaccharide biosynthesis protein